MAWATEQRVVALVASLSDSSAGLVALVTLAKTNHGCQAPSTLRLSQCRTPQVLFHELWETKAQHLEPKENMGNPLDAGQVILPYYSGNLARVFPSPTPDRRCVWNVGMWHGKSNLCKGYWCFAFVSLTKRPGRKQSNKGRLPVGVCLTPLMGPKHGSLEKVNGLHRQVLRPNLKSVEFI